MYLKSLTLKGFKSFAAPTTLRFEPGITAVVGPNGSGKSNVVDALAWVMGEQGAKTLRGGKMEDVIFAGTSSRAPLGRAEVTVSIDNSDNALPIEYTEVSITRRMFRDGASEYEINGSSCRLMDVQELLSDSGIGREMHVIVGQGKLEEILQSRPEDRRAFIEEAAGVLKHRKRKEKALRKLDTMAANLARLTDLTTELRRQLKPLGRQAEAAQRAAAIQADLRDARLRLAADDLVSRRAEREAVFQAEAAMRREHDEAAARLAVASEELAAHESAVAELSTRAESIQHTWFGLSALAERVDATVRIASERAHHLDIEPVAVSDTDPRKPEELEAEAQQVAVAEQQLLAELDAARARLDAARAELADRERRAAEADRAHLAAVREEADRREGLARLAGQVETMRARVESIDESVARLSERIEDAAMRAQQTRAEFETVQGRIGELDQGEVGLDEHHERTVAALRLADERVAELQSAERAAERQVASLRARIDALAVGLQRKDGAAWLAHNRSGAGLFGSIAQLVKVRSGYEAALAAALGPAADALAVDGLTAAGSAVSALKQADGGRAVLVLSDWPAPQAPQSASGEMLPSGAQWALDLVESPPQLVGAMIAMLSGVAVVNDLTEAMGLVEIRPELRAVTVDGDLVGAGWVSGGSDRKLSTLEVTSEIDKARAAFNCAARTRPSKPWPRLTNPTRPSRRCTSSWAASGRRPARRKKSGTGCCSSVRNRKPCAHRLSTTSYNLRPSCVRPRRPNGCRWPNRSTARRSVPLPIAPAVSKWKPGWRCAPPRNAPTRFAGGPIRCAVRLRRNVRRGCGLSKHAPQDCMRPRWPQRSPTADGCWPGGCTGRWTGRRNCATRRPRNVSSG